METFYYNLAGGVNQASTKTELGLDTKQIYWTDSKNIEIHQNKGIIRQNGNKKLFELAESEEIIALHQMKYAKKFKLLVVTKSGKMYVYNPVKEQLIALEKTLVGKPEFVDFLNGVIVCSGEDTMFFIKNNDSAEIVECNLKNASGNDVKSDVIAVHKGRVWVAQDANIYFSALGSYSDFTTAEDAGYISNFHNDTEDIIALKPYKDYLAIYKKNMVYLLTGSTPKDFAIVPFADKGAFSSKCVVNVNNKQYFLNYGIFALEQVGELNQIQLGSEITQKIKPEFDKFDGLRYGDIIALHYEVKNQVWYFIPYKGEKYFHTIWINDYVNKAWFKRVIPQNIITACMFNDYVVTASVEGVLYREDFGPTFDGQPVSFMWKSPFLSIGAPDKRKTIDEFYFLLDESYENNFNFSVYKNFDSEYKDDLDVVFSTNFDNMTWEDEDAIIVQNFAWDDEEGLSLWAVNTESVYKAEISEANYSIQLCVEGESSKQNAAIIGLEFKEIYKED